MASNKGRAFDKFFNNLDFTKGKPRQGRVLISEPFLLDPNFNHSVVLLTRYDHEGSLGFVLNHRSEYKINEVIEAFPEFDAPVYLGGPVGIDSLFYIHTLGEKLPDSVRIIEDLYWGGDFDILKEQIVQGKISTEEIIFFIGYSGWEEGQLDDEISSESWIIADIQSEDIMKQPGKKMWKETLRKLGKDFKIMANFPRDPSLN